MAKVDSLAHLQNTNIAEAVTQAVNFTANRFQGQGKGITLWILTIM